MVEREGVLVAQVFLSTFLAVWFLQASADKLLNWRSSREAFAATFEKTPARWAPSLFLTWVLLLELGAGILSAAGALEVLLLGEAVVAFVGACFGGLAVLSLFCGHRLAKDAAGAAATVPYFLATVLSVLVLSAR